MELGWGQVLTIVGANIVLIMGMLGTYIALYVHNDKKIETNRKESTDLLKAINEEMKDFHQKYMEETRSFHGRLVSIEERNRPKII